MNKLDVSSIVNVTISLAPMAIQYENFGTGLIVGDSDVIDTGERIRRYANISGVSQDFGTTAPEYKAALLHFSQDPRPAVLFIGRWAATATKGRLNGAPLTTAQQLLSVFTAVTNGSMKLAVNGGTVTAVSGVNFSAALNLNGVASILQTALQAVVGWSLVTCEWDAVYSRFVIKSGTTGASSSISFATAPTAGTDIGVLMGLNSGQGGSVVAGMVAETPVASITALADVNREWYAAGFATTTAVTDQQHIDVAQFIEASARSRLYGVTIQNPNVLDSTTSADLASSLMTLKLKRTFTQYSSSSPYAAISLFARAATVNFNANNATITLKFKQEPGVAAEGLTETQAATLKAKNCNVFAAYVNGAAIIQEGVMANGYFFDSVHGWDWFQNAAQTDVFNLLYQSPTKIPQTDDGVNMIVAVLKATCARAVNNGLVAPGVWNGPPIGQLKTGATLSSGYYVYAPLVSSQSQADREARKAPPIQIAAKESGAIHSADVICTVNR